ncbi:hypothetical protein BJ508DRAFT_328026 [Ascobolus immersus RN42]|uniref:F-box domain-containing protein n=1 Tax=Ascobolus immersus RN42 TaxID=1160509 RepID=A0A3N4I6I0_ASCIM|nr:hypothetical protein BJ508DRAFT_328026 [Ascobolus immersus RN42]
MQSVGIQTETEDQRFASVYGVLVGKDGKVYKPRSAAEKARAEAAVALAEAKFAEEERKHKLALSKLKLAVDNSSFLRLPLEIQIQIFQHIDSSKDIISLHRTHSAFRRLLTGPYCTQICSKIAIRRWKSKGGLPLLDMICNGLVNPFLRETLRYWYDWRGRDWALSEDTGREESPSIALRVGPRELLIMDVFERETLQPKLRSLLDNWRLLARPASHQGKVGPPSASEVLRMERALFLIFGMYKHYHQGQPGLLTDQDAEMYAVDEDGRPLVDDSGDWLEVDPYRAFPVYDAKGFMEEVSVEEHYHIACAIRLLLQVNWRHVYFSYDWVILELWNARIGMVNEVVEARGLFLDEAMRAQARDRMRSVLGEPHGLTDEAHSAAASLVEEMNLPRYGWPGAEHVDSDMSNFRTVFSHHVLNFVHGPAETRRDIARAELVGKVLYVPNATLLTEDGLDNYDIRWWAKMDEDLT